MTQKVTFPPGSSGEGKSNTPNPYFLFVIKMRIRRRAGPLNLLSTGHMFVLAHIDHHQALVFHSSPSLPSVRCSHFSRNHGAASQFRASQGAAEGKESPLAKPQQRSPSFSKSRQKSSLSIDGGSECTAAITLERKPGHGIVSKVG